MPLSLTILGTSGSYPSPRRACSGYLIQAGGANVWLEAGSGSMANLQEHIELSELDAVVLTHEHPDHSADINGLEVACSFGPGPDRVPVYAPAPVRDRLYKFKKSALEWNVVSDGTELKIGGQSWRFSKTDHPPETMAVRIEADGASLGFTSDTGPGWSASALGPVDALLSEATFQDEDAEAAEHGVGHLSARQAGQMAKDCGIPRLILTHIWPEHDREVSRQQAEEAFGAGVEVAAEHDLFVIGEEDS